MSKKIQSKTLKQYVTDDDITWIRESQESNINKITGDEIYAAKSAHAAQRFKQSKIYQARSTNRRSLENSFGLREELDYHESRAGWWEYEKDLPIVKNIHKEWHYTR